ncbi:aspartate carbamoyltransferase regulatory subunit [Ancylomarina euxinus]|uniref:Aspartate carbamoyltransferase regulatory chain n=1 Tax=Ancylomarina euxinus TaxID=2283627 RepID=A0A425XZQ8_9BACT|nr:aspartate carbamoyltransferase regulatory subunit [Ancylomarina euxinus]MCZ4694844.1 aspartate carbamoyltransferase regulatory subunit [Ancylomarina euxinus]MUP15918.1 aspartate carbamoyltransferase regulatory subunit [Ancylomarina euxinus]RRG20554.1 aspartate carbamoyltransferase regulatory subunit [Ancylomarina euxinus]
MTAKKELQVRAIKNGTVIDHIPADLLFKVINILELDKCSTSVTIGNNYKSDILGKKGIIKISEKFFEAEEINKISLIAPNVKFNIIKDYQVVEKSVVEAPNNVEGIVKCMNPKCITNVEEVYTKFKVMSSSPITLKCHYCEKITDHKNITIK